MTANFRRLASAALSAALIGAAGAARAQTQSYFFNFDNVAAGTLVSALPDLPDTILVDPGVFDFERDSNGVAIPGTQRWRVDPNAPAVPVVAGDTEFPAPSPPNLMGDTFSPILLSLQTPLSHFNSVSFTLDNDPFGESGIEALLLNASGVTVASVVTDQTQPGASYTLTSPNRQAVYLLLPAGASYDNLTVTASPGVFAVAPEPGTLGLLAAGFLTSGILLRRRA